MEALFHPLPTPQLYASVLAAHALIALYLRAVCLPQRPGLARLTLALPVLALQLCMPLWANITTQIAHRASIMFAASWLGTFKVGGVRVGGGGGGEGQPEVRRACVRACAGICGYQAQRLRQRGAGHQQPPPPPHLPAAATATVAGGGHGDGQGAARAGAHVCAGLCAAAAAHLPHR